MKKAAASLLILALLLIPARSVNACWVYLTVDELFEMSDTIIIGTIVDKDKALDDQIKWTMEVDYYLKGEQEKINLPVYTADENVSIHIDLGTKGTRLLLFLGEGGNVISPQGVYDVTVYPEYKLVQADNGEALLMLMTLNAYDEVFMKDLEAKIIRLKEVTNMFDQKGSEGVKETTIAENSLLTASAGIIGLLGIGISVFTTKKKL